MVDGLVVGLVPCGAGAFEGPSATRSIVIPAYGVRLQVSRTSYVMMHLRDDDGAVCGGETRKPQFSQLQICRLGIQTHAGILHVKCAA